MISMMEEELVANIHIAALVRIDVVLQNIQINNEHYISILIKSISERIIHII